MVGTACLNFPLLSDFRWVHIIRLSCLFAWAFHLGLFKFAFVNCMVWLFYDVTDYGCWCSGFAFWF